MCGFGCVIERERREPSKNALRRLSRALVHRGPDDEGMLVQESVGLVFRRLAIIDLSADGHQPMLSGSGRYAIVFNGEIFNYIELRAELASKGHVFKSSSDTEVLLNAYVEWGAECLPRLNGMFAFVILDTATGECFCARDRFGVKPLYCFRDAKRIIFASEVSAVLRSGLCRPSVDRSSVAKYLFFGTLDNNGQTFYEGITAVAPGSWVSIDRDRKIRSARYWELPTDTDTSPDCAKLYDLFESAVKLRLRSDVPVGVFLSGGLDSTSIVCAAARRLGQTHPVDAYSFMPPEYDESQYIKDTIKQTAANLMPLETDAPRLWGQLVRMARYQDGPVHSPSALIGFCLCEMAASHGTKVILNGQGADETFAGYPNYFRIHWQSLLSQRQVRTLVSQLASYGSQHGIATAPLIRQVLAVFVRAQLSRINFYRRAAAWRSRRALREHPLYTQDLVDCMPLHRGL
jgi:asparagine synthase (glutamine-hydrolysing)